MFILQFLVSFFGKLVVGAAVVSAVITMIEMIRYRAGRKDGSR